MPIISKSMRRVLPYKVITADTFITRLFGLMGHKDEGNASAFHLLPCDAVHTFGMAYAVDIMFLDKNYKIVGLHPHVKPGKIAVKFLTAHSTIEFPAGTIELEKLALGQQLRIISDCRATVQLSAIKNLLHWPLNIVMAILWSKFVVFALQDLLDSGGILSAGILIHNTLLLVLFLTRRESQDTSRKITDWLVALGTLCCAMLLRPQPLVSPWLASFSGYFQVIGLYGISVSLFSLGRSFGVIPANRLIKYSGVYSVVRHPLYATEMLFYVAFLLGNYSFYNLAPIFLIAIGQVWRSLAEENLLAKDIQYQEYLATVRYRFVPGVF